MLNTFLYPWKQKSKGASVLSKALEIKRILRENSQFQGGSGKTVINWGCSQVPDQVRLCRIINQPAAVGRSSNKLKFFRNMTENGGGRVPEFTTSISTASEWEDRGQVTVGRTKLQGYAGSDIAFLVDDPDKWSQSVLWTQYIKKDSEYRIHFAFGKIFDYQKKVLPNSIDKNTIDFRVRNHKAGFIFARKDLQVPDDVIRQAQACIEPSGLDFGAADIIYDSRQDLAYVLEINTAPGIEGTTLKNYAQVFTQALGDTDG